ncbi:Fe3+-hydroxamate ABC transporter substrate-binding protein, partial [Alicyclobacillaceae bacterium I2511]
MAPELILCDPTVDRALRSIAPSEVVDIYPTEQGVWHSASAFTLRLAARLELESRAIADLQVANE